MMNQRTLKTRKLLALLEKHSAKFSTTRSVTAANLYNEIHKDENVKIILEYDLTETLVPFIGDEAYTPYIIGFIESHELNERARNFLFIDVDALYKFIDRLDQATDNNVSLDDVE